jgi:hypothetical protein
MCACRTACGNPCCLRLAATSLNVTSCSAHLHALTMQYALLCAGSSFMMVNGILVDVAALDLYATLDLIRKEVCTAPLGPVWVLSSD